ncbi:MAG: hypothetical protein M0Z99_13265 [Betaproteobacteria bacterium]|nr:hypothetical protein [Betaproteobacteria bacterium]
MSTVLTLRALAALPPDLQQAVRANHHPADDLGELISEVALALLEAGQHETFAKIFSRARSRCRRFTQDPAHYGAALDVADAQGHEIDDAAPAPRKARALARARIEADQGVSKRTAQRRIKAQLELARVQGDLFDMEVAL